MISIKNLRKVYNGTKVAVDDLSLEIKEGEIFGLLGPNGAGKSTTIKMLMGIVNPDGGSISINGFDIDKDPIKAKLELGYVPDNPDMYIRLKGIEYINFIADIYGTDESFRLPLIDELSNIFSMKEALNDKIQSYSHGMRQKIVLMGALIHNPNVWVLDEPMTGLDPKASFTLKQMMRKHADLNNTVIFSTHVLDVAEKVCDRVGIINKGKLLFVGKVSELRDKLGENGTLEELFLEMTENE